MDEVPTNKDPETTNGSNETEGSISPIQLKERIVGIGGGIPKPEAPILSPFENFFINLVEIMTPGDTQLPFSTTRPRTLPPKVFAEELKHRQEHQEMLSAYQKKVEIEADIQRSAAKKEKKRKLRVDGNYHSWSTVILPSIARVREQTVSNLRDIWWEGVPDQLKSKVWTTAMATFTKETLTQELYESVLAQANEIKERPPSEPHSPRGVSPPSSPPHEWRNFSGTPDILSAPTSPRLRRVRYNPQPDVVEWSEVGAISRVLNQIYINTPAPFPLSRAKTVLDTYLCHTKIECNEDLIYTSVLLLNFLEDFEVFQILNIIFHSCFALIPGSIQHNRITKLKAISPDIRKSFLDTHNKKKLARCCFILDNLIIAMMPKLYAHFTEIRLDSTDFLPHWLPSFFMRVVDFDTAVHIFDVFVLEGEHFMFHVAMAILKILHPLLTAAHHDAAKDILRHPGSKLNDSLLFRTLKEIPFSQAKFCKFVENCVNTQKNNQQDEQGLQTDGPGLTTDTEALTSA